MIMAVVGPTGMDPAKNAEGKTTGTGFPVSIHAMQESEAAEVAGLMYLVYRDTYPEKYLYDPARVAESARNGGKVSAVACDTDGHVVGYAELRPYPGYPEIGTLSTLAVAPQWRNRGVGAGLVRYCVQAGSRLNYICLNAPAPTAYAYPQQILKREEFVPTVFLPAAIAEGIEFVDITGKLRHRESVFCCTKMNVCPGYGPQFIPGEYAKIVLDLCDALNIRIMSGSGGYLPPVPTDAELETDVEWATGHIRLRTIGPDYRDAICDMVSRFERAGTKTLRLHVDLSDPGAPAAIGAAERKGFFFAGILPARTGLVMVLEHLENPQAVTKRFHARSPMAKRLRAEFQSRTSP